MTFRPMSVLVLAAVLLLSLVGAPTAAWFSQRVAMGTGALTSHLVAPPPTTACSNGSSAVTISWPGDVRYDYEVTLRRSSGAVISVQNVTGAATSITYSGLAAFDMSLTLATVLFEIDVRPYLHAAPDWRSDTARTHRSVEVSNTLLGSTIRCA